jgi:hypothetical protein
MAYRAVAGGASSGTKRGDRGMTRKNELMPILPAERDPRLITMRRGGTLQTSTTGCLRSGPPSAPNTSCTFSSRSSRATPARVTLSTSVVPGSGARFACVMRTGPLSWRMLPHVDCPTRRSSPLLRPGRQWRWPTSQPTTWELRPMRSGQLLLPLSPVRQSQHASGNETGSEKEFPRRFESWSLMTSSVEARSAGTSSTTDL